MRSACLSLILSICIAIFFFYDDWDQHIQSPPKLEHLTNDPIFFSPVEIALLHEIAERPLCFLAEGGQFYVFTSWDKKYVLKFFKFHRCCTQWFISCLPSYSVLTKYKRQHIVRRKKRLRFLIEGVQIAYHYLKEESGLKCMQLKPSSQNLPTIRARKNGREYVINLAQVPFVLQEKGEILSEIFARLIERGKIGEVKEKIAHILRFYLKEYSKGLRDVDHGVMHNLGFVGKNPIHLDFGKLIFDPELKCPACYSMDLLKVADKIGEWFTINYPEYMEEINDCIFKQLQDLGF